MAAVEVDAPGGLPVVVVERAVAVDAPGSLAPGAKDFRGLEIDWDNVCLCPVVPEVPVGPDDRFTVAALVELPFVRDVDVETGFIFDGVSTALGRLCLVLGDSCSTSFPLSVAEVEACAAGALIRPVLLDSAELFC